MGSEVRRKKSIFGCEKEKTHFLQKWKANEKIKLWIEVCPSGRLWSKRKDRLLRMKG